VIQESSDGMDDHKGGDGAAWEGEMFRLLAENVHDYAIFLVDADRHVRSWSRGAERLLGFTADEIVGRKCDVFFTPEDVRDGVPQKELDEALATGRGDDDRWHVRKDGTRFWSSGTVTPLRDAGGALRGFGKIMRDRTDLKRADEALRERQRQLEFVTDRAPVLLAQVDADYRFKFVNLPYAERFGLHPRDLVGKSLREMLGADAYATIRPHADEALAGRRVEYEAEVPYDGIGTRTMQVRYEPERGADGRVVGYVAAVLDITDRRRAEQELAASRRRLQAIFDTSLDAILLADDRAGYVDANPAACDLLGYGREELLRRGVFDVTPPPDGEAGRAAWEAFVRDGRQAGEYAVTRSDGSAVAVEYRAVANVQPGLHLSVLRDVSERRRTEQALRASELRFKTLAAGAPVGIFETDAEGNCLFVNRRWCEMAGMTPEEAAGRGWSGALHPEDRDRIFREWYASAAGGGEFTAEYRFRTPGGRVTWLSGSAVALRDGSGVVVGYIGTVTDITGQKLAEATLRESEGRLRAIIDNSPSVIFVKDADGRYLLANQACAGYSGDPPEKMLGKTDRDYLPPEYADRFRADDLRVLRTGEVIRYEEEALLHGRVCTALTVKFPLRDAEGRPYAVCGIATDVTEFKQAGEAQRASEARLRAVLDSIPVGVIVAEAPSGRLVLGNPQADEIWGFRMPPAGSVEEYRPYHGFHADGRPYEPHEWPLARSVATGESVSGEEIAFGRGDGTRGTLRVSSAPIRDADGRVTAAVVVFADITDRLAAEEALRASEARLAEAQRIAGVGSWEIDWPTRKVLWSDETYRLLGVTRGEYEPTIEGFFAVVPPEDQPAVRRAVEDALAGRAQYRIDHRVVRADGAVRVVSEQAEVAFGPGGEPLRVVGTILDITDRVRAEQALRETEAQLRSLSDNLPRGAVYQVRGDPAGARRFTYISAGVERLLGVTPAEVMADPAALYGLVHEDDLPRVAAGEEAALRDLAPFDCEFRSRTRAGGLVWIHARSAPRRLPTGETVWEGIITDVTARKSAERERTRLALLVENATDFIGISDTEYRPFYVNRAGLRLVGLESLEEALRVPVPEFFFPEDRTFIADEFLPRVLRDGHGEVEIRFRHFRTGEPLWVVYTVILLRDEGGAPAGLATITRDVTERRQKNERMRLLAEAAEVLLYADDPDAMLRTLFARIGPHLGLDAYFNFMVDDTGDALRLASCVGVPDETARSIARLEFGQAVCGTVAQHHRPIVATRIQESDDPKVQLVRSFGLRAYACHPLMSGDRLLGTLSFATRSRDSFDEAELDFLRTICHNVTVAYERVRLIRRLREQDRRKDDFLATLAHELRNPLAPIRNGLQVLQLAGGDRAIAGRAVAMMERQLGQMVRLIDDLLDVSRITRGKLLLRKERVELAGVVRAAVETARPALDAGGHRLEVSLPDEPVWVDADPTRLAQVFGNLLTNAAKYTDRGGRVRLTAHPEGGGVVVSVEDNGIGIAAEHLAGVFEMFNQVTPVIERSQGGLGIGLALVRGLVEMHGGTVEAHSEGPGRGSIFTVRLPAARPTPPETLLPAPEVGAARPAMRILVADDNRDAADSLTMLLQLAGHEVRTAHDGREAVEAAAAFRPDVALLDIGMPGLTGYEVARRVREQPGGAGVVLVAITGWGQEEDKRRAAEAGFDHHLTKPVDPLALERLLSALTPRT
jgi:PAS domain S-box-containing protein